MQDEIEPKRAKNSEKRGMKAELPPLVGDWREFYTSNWRPDTEKCLAGRSAAKDRN